MCFVVYFKYFYIYISLRSTLPKNQKNFVILAWSPRRSPFEVSLICFEFTNKSYFCISRKLCEFVKY